LIREILEDRQRVALTGEIVVDAALNLRASVAMLLAPDLARREPEGADDALVESPVALFAQRPRDEREAQVGDPLYRVTPAGYAEQRLRLDVPGRFLGRLAHDRVEQRFPFVQMARRLVEHQGAVGALLDEEKAAVALDHGGDRYVRLPHHARKCNPVPGEGSKGGCGVVGAARTGP